MTTTASLEALHRGQALAAEILATGPERLAWVGVYPLNLDWQSTQNLLRRRGVVVPPNSDRAYRIRVFEVQRQLVDEDMSIGEPDLDNFIDEVVFGDETLISRLKALSVGVERLALPYRSNYPI